jgi:hypothetical protein
MSQGPDQSAPASDDGIAVTPINEPVTVKVSGPFDFTVPYEDPPPGVKIVSTAKTMSLHGEAVLVLILLVEAVEAVGLNLLSDWISETFFRRRRADQKIEITVEVIHIEGDNNFVVVVSDTEGVRSVEDRIRRDELGT